MTRVLQIAATLLFCAAVAIVLWCAPKRVQSVDQLPVDADDAPITRQVLYGGDSVQAIIYLRRRQLRWAREHPDAEETFPNECHLCNCCTATPRPKYSVIGNRP